MRKIIFFFALAFLNTNTFFALANDKTSIGVLPIKTELGLANSDGKLIEDAISNAFLKTNRFTVVDRGHMSEIHQEKKLQKSTDFIDGVTIEQGKSIGAQYFISSTVSSYHNDGSVCKFELSLQVIEIATGRVESSEQISVKGGSHGKKFAGAIGGAVVGSVIGVGPAMGAMVGARGGNTDKALQKALDDISDQIDEFVAKHFPITFSIIEISEKGANGAAKKLLIGGGTLFGLKKGDHLKVVEMTEMEIDGKMVTRKTELGQLKITVVEDENFSVCSVVTEENRIAEKFEAKKKIKVITID